MSAFLGPIHVKMYDRILYQDTLSQAFADLSAAQGWGEVAREIDDRAPAAVKQPLETIIDAGNIHAWLSEAVARCERRFALTVCKVLDKHPERLEELQRIMREKGRERLGHAAMNAKEAYASIHDILLDGMPCDAPFSGIKLNPGDVEWQVVNCPHAPYWAKPECDTEIYYNLRDAWVDGALSHSGITHSRPTLHCHTLKKG